MEGKAENAGYQHFLLFLQYFLKDISSGVSKLSLCGKGLKDSEKGNLLILIIRSDSRLNKNDKDAGNYK